MDKGKKSIFYGNSIVYSFESAPRLNVHIQDYAVYIDTLVASDFARALQGYYCVQDLTSRHLWIGIRIWGFWMTNFFFSAVVYRGGDQRMQCWWALSLEIHCIRRICTGWMLLEVIIILILSLVLSHR